MHDNRTYAKYQIKNPDHQESMRAHLSTLPGSIEEEENHCLYRVRILRGLEEVFVRQFLNGTLTVDGPPESFAEVNDEIQAVLRQMGLTDIQTPAQKQEQTVRQVSLSSQWIGIDEAGKGDYFGPLVSAAVLLDTRKAQILETLGVHDSKRISDNFILELAVQIEQVCKHKTVKLPPITYNRLYTEFKEQGKNLNALLAWAHARALEDLLLDTSLQGTTVLIDKFAPNKVMQDALLPHSRTSNIKLVQLPKAEVNIGVAAASVLARAYFLKGLKHLSKQFDLELPKGGSNQRILSVGQEMLVKHGQQTLEKIAKLHFKTTQKIMQTKMF
jgi:ribonuclease HIII